MIRLVIATPIILSGLAHLSGIIASWTSTRVGFSPDPWILSQSVTLQSSIGRVVGALWLAAAAGLVVGGLGMVLRQGWWPTVTAVSAALSLLTVALWWNSVPPGAKAGAALDILLILALLLPVRDHLVGLVR